MRCILSCRPAAVSLVKPLVTQAYGEAASVDIDLPQMSKQDATALAAQCLGDGLQHLAERLVTIADRNPLVIRVGARCISDKRVLPEMLERTPEVFRSLVLDRLLDDPGLAQEDAPLRKKVLEIIATVGPVVSEGEEFEGKLSEIINVPAYELRRLLASLERAALLMRRGRLVRVNPDVLADHLLYRAAVSETGSPTGFVDAMIKAFAPTSLENILANAAELDWRATATATHESVLATTWREMLDILPGSTHSQRAQLVSQLKRAAIFAPAQVLGIVEWIADHPDAPPDEQAAAWGLEDSPARVTDSITEIFALIATHPEFTKRCVRRLWTIAADDERPTPPNPSHPRRCLEDLLKYEWRSDWQNPDGIHAKAVQFMAERLQDPERAEDATWAVALLGSALDRLGDASVANRRQFTIRHFSLAQYLTQIASRRRLVIECLKGVALGQKPSEAVTALHQIGRLISAPGGPFGKDLKVEEVAAWEPEAETAIAILIRVAESASSEVIRFLARRELREASREHWPALAPKLERALSSCPRVAGEQVYDLLEGIPWQERAHDRVSEEERVKTLCSTAASDYWKAHTTAIAIVESLLEAITALRKVSQRLSTESGRLVQAIIAANPKAADQVVRELIRSGVDGWHLLRPAILSLHDQQTQLAEDIIAELSVEEEDLLRACAGDVAQWMVESAVDPERILAMAQQLSHDSSITVRRTVTQLLRRFREKAPAEAMQILINIPWGGDISLAEATFDALHPEFGLDPNDLSDGDVDALLGRIEELQTLEGHVHDVLEFIAFASTRRPGQTVEMLIRRVQAVDEHSAERGDDKWTPIPYNGHGLTLPGLGKSKDYLVLLGLVRDALLGASGMVRFWLPELFHVAVADLQGSLSVLREWLRSGDQERIVGAAHLLHGFDHSIVFSSHDFVAELLDAANQVGHECLQHASSELFCVAIGGVYGGTPGEPAPRHLSDKAKAQGLVEHYRDRLPARGFYTALVGHAEDSIRREMQEWDEGDEE